MSTVGQCLLHRCLFSYMSHWCLFSCFFVIYIPAWSNCTHMMPGGLPISCKLTSSMTLSAPFVKTLSVLTFMEMSVLSPSARCKTVYNWLFKFGWLYGICFNLFLLSILDPAALNCHAFWLNTLLQTWCNKLCC